MPYGLHRLHSPRVRNTDAVCAGAAILEKRKVGNFLYREGDMTDCAYVIAEGNVVLFRAEDRRRRVIERRGSGSIFGEVSVLRGLPRAVSVLAEANCIVFRISAEQIEARFADLDPLMTACIETTIGFIESVNNSIQCDAIPISAISSCCFHWLKSWMLT